MGLKATTLCLGYQQITSLSGSTGLTVPKLNGQQATLAVITVEAQTVRWRDDGTAPTASVGMPVVAAATLYYDGDLSRIRFIEATAGAILNISYYA